MSQQDKVIVMRCKAFSGEGVREHKVMVSGNEVRVWDSIAGHYTSCHSLGRAAVARAIRAATMTSTSSK